MCIAFSCIYDPSRSIDKFRTSAYIGSLLLRDMATFSSLLLEPLDAAAADDALRKYEAVMTLTCVIDCEANAATCTWLKR